MVLLSLVVMENSDLRVKVGARVFLSLCSLFDDFQRTRDERPRRRDRDADPLCTPCSEDQSAPLTWIEEERCGESGGLL